MPPVTNLQPFHRMVGRLDFPMLVVTAAAQRERAGCLVGFATQCSIHPPRYLVCLSRANHTFRIASQVELLAVHVLDEADFELAVLFGEETGDDLDKFARCSWRQHRGQLILTEVKAWFIGRVLQRIELGDHVGHLLEPVDAHFEGALRQLPFQRVRRLTPGHPA